MQESQDTQAQFTVVVAGVLHDECGFPIEFRGKRKGQAALGYVLRVFGRVEGKTHLICCYSNNCTLLRGNPRFIAERWGVLEGRRQLAGRPLNVPDGQVAATAPAHDPVITLNAKRFAGFGVTIFNSWDTV
jgi:hypothetical protein